MGMQYSRGLIAGYPFENTGADITGTYPLTISGVTYGGGLFGNCGIFDGVDDMGNNANFIPTVAGTWSVWFNVTGWGTDTVYGRRTLLNLPAGAGSIETTGTNLIRVRLYDTTFRDQNITIPNLNEWYHLAVVFGVGFRRYYLNCVPINDTIFGGYNLTWGNGIWIGCNYNRLYRFSGLIDQLQIFNRALNINEIKRLYLNLGI